MIHINLLTLAQADPPPADTSQVTTAWMAGVVGMMVLFGIIAFVGYVKQRLQKTPAEET